MYSTAMYVCVSILWRIQERQRALPALSPCDWIDQD